MRNSAEMLLKATVLESLRARAETAGRHVNEEAVRMRGKLSTAERVQLSRENRAMTPHEPPQGDSTLLIRWYRDTSGGRDTDDGWTDDARS